MRRLIKPIFWTALFLLMLLVIDQFFVQVPPIHPAHQAVSNFYKDFRGRLIGLTFGEKQIEPESVEAVIENQQSAKGKTTAKNAGTPDNKPARAAKDRPPEPAQRYIYSDGKGELHFADSLEEVPDKYRGQAQPMGE
ncbi:MAG: hypothetical protein AB1Z51_03325 [Desulfuromonadales bacterium]